MITSLDFFKEITQIPRPSKKEGKIREYLIHWAISKNYEYKIDNIGNLIVYATSNNSSEWIILQAHMDMVCVKTPDSKHDFLNHPLDIYEEDGFLKARNTTLGADNGIGIALMMAAEQSENRPNLELVFTIDEEEGLGGALGLDFSLLNSKKVINLDSEDENEICISSAGGARVSVHKDIEVGSAKHNQYILNISGLNGGHSGIDIGNNQGNAIYLLMEFLGEYGFSIEVVSIKGGTADNVIPSSVDMIFGVAEIEIFKKSLGDFIENIKNKFDCPEIKFEIKQSDKMEKIISDFDFILSRILSQKIGVISMSQKIEGLVQTSVNLGILDLSTKGFEITYLPRSSDMNEFERLLDTMKNNYSRKGYEFNIDSRYPGWQDDPEGELVKIASKEIKNVIGEKPKILAIHAGLECGALVAGLGEGASAISIGPNIYDVHSINERVEIESIQKIEIALGNILERLK